jgi:hypothetical protein
LKNETAIGPAGAPERGGHPPGGTGLGSPFQARAQFFKNWDWQFVISVNRGACERGRAQHGTNSETREACASEWESFRPQALTLGQAIDHLRSFHRRAPFLFFNGNTFATIGRELTLALFSDLPPVRKREASSAIAHYIAGVLDREPMVAIVESLCETASFQTGDRVKTLRGSTHGLIIRLLDDGRVAWRPDGSQSELIALPESLTRERNAG